MFVSRSDSNASELVNWQFHLDHRLNWSVDYWVNHWPTSVVASLLPVRDPSTTICQQEIFVATSVAAEHQQVKIQYSVASWRTRKEMQSDGTRSIFTKKLQRGIDTWVKSVLHRKIEEQAVVNLECSLMLKQRHGTTKCRTKLSQSLEMAKTVLDAMNRTSFIARAFVPLCEDNWLHEWRPIASHAMDAVS